MLSMKAQCDCYLVCLVFPYYVRALIENVAELEGVNRSSSFKTFTESQVNITLMCKKCDLSFKRPE